MNRCRPPEGEERPLPKTRRVSYASLASAIALAVALSGCIAPHLVLEWATPMKTLSPTSPSGWEEGNWFAYHAYFPTRNRSLDVSLIIDEVRPGEIILGSNSTHGFFGLPFAGNVTRPDLNPVISGEEWPLYRFPLEAGKSWDYSLFGYPVTAYTEETEIPAIAGMDAHRGFVMEASSYGHMFARYTYSPVAQWFTTMTVFDAASGEALVIVDLTAFGTNFGDAYYVNVPLKTVAIVYPSLKQDQPFLLPDTYETLSVILKLGGTGAFTARFVDPSGRTRAEGEVIVQGVSVSRAELTATAGEYVLKHRGAGDGFVRLEVYGLAVANADSAKASSNPRPEPFDFAWHPFGVLSDGNGPGHPNVVRLPQVGQDTSTGAPL